MGLISETRMFARFLLGLRGFLGHRLTVEEAMGVVQARLAKREENFLRLVRLGIFGHAQSPYLPLFRQADCGIADVEAMVRRDGLEGALRSLREAGVYVTFEEFKGRQPIVRGGREVPVEPHDFDNPYLSACYYARTGGSTGAGTRVQIDLEHLAAQAPYSLLANEAHGMRTFPRLVWLGTPPDAAGTNSVLHQARFGQTPRHWFSPLGPQHVRPALRYRLGTRAIPLIGRLCGAAIPRPVPLGLDQAAVVARCAADLLQSEGACLMSMMVSNAVRVAVAACELGLSLEGAAFWGGGEPPTPAKVRTIQRSGARWVPGYWFTEAGVVGQGCARPADENDIHFCRDSLALIQYPRKVPGTEIAVETFHFTTLLPTAPKLMLNVESDDYGVVENRSCGCLLEQCGLTEHLGGIRSFRKLTSEGVTLVGSEMERILEELLPARFGGTPLDYQLSEYEDEQGFTRLSLVVSPTVELRDEQEVVGAVLDALKRSSGAAELAAAVWAQASTLQVKRAAPVTTRAGKQMPLHFQGKESHP